MTENDIDNYLKLLKEIRESKKILDNLVIEWETDIDNMNFSALRSQLDFNVDDKHQKVSIEKIDLNNEYNGIEMLGLERDYFSDKATIDLIKFIAKGNKIIPPLRTKHIEFCGETFTYKEIPGIQRNDGSHRVFVSKYIGLTDIPVIMCERVVKFTFPIDKWDFEYTNGNFIAKSKSNLHKIEFNITANTYLNNEGLKDNSLIICR